MVAKENFYYIEGACLVKDVIKTLATEFTKNANTYKWTLVYPKALESVENFALIKCTTRYGQAFYVSLEREEQDLNFITVKTGKEIEERSFTKTIPDTEKGGKATKELKITRTDLVQKLCSNPARLAWYRPINASFLADCIPVEYWITQTKDSINLVLRGDPSLDSYPNNNYLTAYAYFGALQPLEDASITDDKFNFGITTSSDEQPKFEQKFGSRTATGVTDVCMIANKIGLPMQVHYPAFYTSWQNIDKCNVEGSRWNGKKHQFSDVTLVHPVDMERGKMENIIVGDGSALHDNDILTFKKDTEEEMNYKRFKITAPYNFLNNSPNNIYCIGIRCYKTTTR